MVHRIRNERGEEIDAQEETKDGDEEIEAKLEKIIAQRFFISSLPDDALGEKVVLMVECAFSEEALQNLEKEINGIDNLARCK